MPEIQLTRKMLDELLEERDQLIKLQYDEILPALKAARENGDLSENAEYDAAKKRQAEVIARISEIDELLKSITVKQDKENN